MEYLKVTNRKEVAARDAIKKALEVATSASSKATHYHTADDQNAAVQETISILDKIGSELPFVVAVQPGVSGFFRQEVVLQDFARGSDGAALILEEESWNTLRPTAERAVVKTLALEAGVPYVLRMFEEAKARRINNRRTSAAIIYWVVNNKNLDFIAVKYRAKIRAVLEHAWGRSTACKLATVVANHLETGRINEAGEKLLDDCIGRYARKSVGYYEPIIAYIFGTAITAYADKHVYPVIHNALRARLDITGIKNVPPEVIFGLVSRPAHPQYPDLWSTREKREATMARVYQECEAVTENTKMRQNKQRATLGVSNVAKIERVDDAIALVKTMFNPATPPDEVNEIGKRVLEIAKEYAVDLPYKKIGVVVDESPSMAGDERESRGTPEAIAHLMTEVICASANKNDGLVTPVVRCSGDSTNLVSGFLSIAKIVPGVEAVFVISDGYENSPYDGALSDAVAAYQRNIANIPVIHLSPIGAAEMGGALRPLSTNGNIISAPANWRALRSIMDGKMLDLNTAAWLKAEIDRIAGEIEPRKIAN